MNKVILSGRLARDIELKRTKDNTAVASFTLAVKNYTKEKPDGATFIDCVAFKELADALKKYTKKSDMIYCIGRILKNTYQDRAGNTKYRTFVIVESVEFQAPAKVKESKEPEESEEDYYEDMAFDIYGNM